MFCFTTDDTEQHELTLHEAYKLNQFFYEETNVFAFSHFTFPLIVFFFVLICPFALCFLNEFVSIKRSALTYR